MSSLGLRKSEWIDDWYVLSAQKGCFADPEGSSVEWRAVIAAVKNDTAIYFKRIAVEMQADGSARFVSPRNARDENDYVNVRAELVPAWIKAAEATLALGQIEEETSAPVIPPVEKGKP